MPWPARSSRSRALTRTLVAAVSLMALTSCVHARDFRSPTERITPHSAYAEGRRGRADVDLLASDSYRFVFNLGATVTALPRRLDFSLNLAHGAMGVLSAQTKFTAFEHRWYALGGRVSLSYLNPRTFWFLPKDLRKQLGSFHLTTIPIEIWNSFPINRWFGLHLGLGYRSSVLAGAYESDSILLDANFAHRGFSVQPVLDVYVASRLALRARARLPVHVEFAEATAAEVELDENVRVGVRSVEWVRRSFRRNVQLELSAETRFGANTHVRLAFNFWAFRPLRALVFLPSLSLYWRF